MADLLEQIADGLSDVAARVAALEEQVKHVNQHFD